MMLIVSAIMKYNNKKMASGLGKFPGQWPFFIVLKIYYVYGAWIFLYTLLGYNNDEVKIMDKNRKKELLEAYKNRLPEMGVISYYCKVTNEVFLGISKDTKSDFNSNNFKLAANWHPNKLLQELWNKYGQENFELSVIKVLKYDDLHEDHTEKLESLREQCFVDNPNARRMWK